MKVSEPDGIVKRNLEHFARQLGESVLRQVQRAEIATLPHEGVESSAGDVRGLHSAEEQRVQAAHHA